MGSNELLQTWMFLQFNRDAQITKRWVNKAIPAHQVLKKRYRHSLEYPLLGKSVTKMATKKTATMDTSSQLSMRSELSRLVKTTLHGTIILGLETQMQLGVWSKGDNSN